MEHLERNHILYELQYGFRRNRSCESQLISLINDLTKSYDAGQQSDVICMDIAKAFDTVPHNRLKLKLQWYGITGITFQWISSFLAMRHQRVVIDNTFSSLTSVTSGVPQGTVLGPTLFLIYINDIIDNIHYSNIRLFADDIILYKQVSSVNDANCLQIDLQSLQHWEEKWLLKFNISKCYVLKITRAKVHKVEYNYQFHNTSLTELNSCKYLGVTIQSDLKWSQHIHQITVKANCTLSLIKRNLRLTSKSLRETAYFTLVRSQLEYASTVWSPWLCKDKLELEKVQRRAARFVCNNYDPMYSVTAMIDELNWQKLENHRNNSRLCLLFKIMQQQIHVPTDDIPPPAPATTTRSSHERNLLVPYARTDVYKYSFFPHAASLWNKLHKTIKETQSLDIFKSRI